MNRITFPIGYYPNPTKGKPISGGSIYIGEPDTDPTVPGNQKTVTALQEDGSEVSIAQPILTSAGGVPLYNGSPVSLFVLGNYSLKALDSLGSQLYYIPDNNISTTEAIEYFDTVADMIAASLVVGSMYATKGYYAPGDGGGAEYLIESGDSSVTYIHHLVNTSDTAVLQHSGTLHTKQCGSKGDSVSDDTAALQALRDYVVSLSDPLKIVFDEGTYLYSTSPNWGFDKAQVYFNGIVRLRNTGTGDNVILDAGSSTELAFNVYFGFDNPPLIEGTATTGNGIYIRSIHHSKIGANVRGCGSSSSSHQIEFSVVSEFNFTASVNEGAWYTGAKPARGIYLDQRNANEQVSACTFYNPIIEQVTGTGITGVYAIQNTFIGGTSEANSKGVVMETTTRNNIFLGLDCEVNTASIDVDDSGDRNEWHNIYSDSTFRTLTGSRQTKIFGGSFNNIIDTGDHSIYMDVSYANNGGTLTLSGTAANTIRMFKMDSVTWGDNNLSTGLSIAEGSTIKKHLHLSTATGAFAVPSSVPGVSVKSGIAVTGASVGDTVVVSSTTVLASNYSMYGIVVSSGVVDIRVHQYTGAAASPFPSGTTVKIDVWGH